MKGAEGYRKRGEREEPPGPLFWATRPRRFRRLLLALGGTAAGLGAVEVGLRIAGVGPSAEFAYRSWFEDASRNEIVLADAVTHGDVVIGRLPRGRPLSVRPHTFHICYRGARGPGFDSRGCVPVDINALGLRDREDLTYEKPPGQKRIVCLGDSFTFGWGVPVESTWPRQIEAELRRRGDVRSVNCGAAGTLLVDEYWWALRDRFGGLAPDVVLVTLCLNDLAPFPDTIALFRGSVFQGCPEHGLYTRWTCADCVAKRLRAHDSPLGWSRLFGLLARADALRARLVLDPEVDWGRFLLEMPEDWPAPNDPKGRTYYEIQGFPPEASWRRGGPQQAMREIRAWCAAHGAAFGVVIWPLFQGLDSADTYPFTSMHQAVAEFGAAEGIEVLDLLPAFLGTDSASWWVDPCDMHANVAAHRRAAPPIAAFVDRIWRKSE